MAKKQSAPKRIKKTVELRVTVEIEFDPLIMPDDEWRSVFYSHIKTPQDLANHLAFNHVQNGICTLRQLDGFADRQNHQASFDITECEVDD